MNELNRDFLIHWGWNPFFENQCTQEELNNLRPARVVGEERGLYRIQGDLTTSSWAEISGRLRFEARHRQDLPAVGDWVLCDQQQDRNRGRIQRVLSRRSLIRRKQVGSSSEIQVVAANCDVMFIATSMNQDLNRRRLERYLILAEDAGCEPVILLTKADLSSNPEAELAKVSQWFQAVKVHRLHQNQFETAGFLEDYLKPGRTAVIVGSSGVGKSTLINYLLGQSLIRTETIRESDAKGKHTTTSRHIYRSRFGGLVMDTPGMREIQMSDHEEGLQKQFHEIERKGSQCRFRDCSHQSEPGCAVREALERGELEEELWVGFLKLQKEIQHQIRKQDKVAASEEKKRWKKKTMDFREKIRSQKRFSGED